MERREAVETILRGGGLIAVSGAIGGAIWGRGLYARSRLEQQLIEEALPIVDGKSVEELEQLPVRARDEIRTWFHGPCANARPFSVEVCSERFQQKLYRCETDELREMLFLSVFLKHVASEAEILNRVELMAEELGSELDRNWNACCNEIAQQEHWKRYFPRQTKIFGDLSGRLQSKIRHRIDDCLSIAQAAGQRPALTQTMESIGTSAVMLLPLLPKPELMVPLFLLAAVSSLGEYCYRLLRDRVGDVQEAVSARLALLGNRIGSELETEISTAIGRLHEWQDQSLRKLAEEQAHAAI